MNKQCVLKDLTNHKFGSLTVLSRNFENTKSGNARWNCICDCGNKAIVIGSKLRSGYTTSCGCARKSEVAQGYSKTRLYRIWKGMHNRCYNPKNDNYSWYGKKGIKICKEWHNFMTFRNWALSNGYQDDLTIDRINPTMDYTPKNCRWEKVKVQANNRTSNRYVWYRGTKYTVAEFADTINVSYWTVINRLKLGWNIDKIANKAKEKNE